MEGDRSPSSAETARLEALASYGIIGSHGSDAIDGIVRLASRICDVPVALATLVDRERLWLMSAVGYDGDRDVDREVTMCKHAITTTTLLHVEDAQADPRFTDNPHVWAEPPVRFYAGMPLVTDEGFALGALCVIDRKPRSLSSFQRDALAELARAVVALMEARRGALERQRALEAIEPLLRKTERDNVLLRLAEQTAEIGHWRFELDADDVYWSPSVYRIHGLSAAEFTPTVANAVRFYHPSDRDAVAAYVAAAVTTQTPYDFCLRIVRPDGAIRKVRSTGVPELDANGKTRAIFGVFHDITAQELQREQTERQARLVTTGTLAAGVGHEINNPLMYVGANLDFALEEIRAVAGPSPSRRLSEILEVLEEAKGGADRIRKIVRGLRAFAREDTPPAATDVHEALDVSVNMSMHEFRHHATLSSERGDVPPVLADESRLSQVFVNLLVNAAQAFAAPDVGNNRVLVRTRRVSADRVAVDVIDNADGMTSDVVARVFDPFFTTKDIGKGTGLGLSISSTIVAAFGGTLTCVSVVGAGTTFTVTLPVARAGALPGA